MRGTKNGQRKAERKRLKRERRSSASKRNAMAWAHPVGSPAEASPAGADTVVASLPESFFAPDDSKLSAALANVDRPLLDDVPDGAPPETYTAALHLASIIWNNLARGGASPEKSIAESKRFFNEMIAGKLKVGPEAVSWMAEQVARRKLDRYPDDKRIIIDAGTEGRGDLRCDDLRIVAVTAHARRWPVETMAEDLAAVRASVRFLGLTTTRLLEMGPLSASERTRLGALLLAAPGVSSPEDLIGPRLGRQPGSERRAGRHANGGSL